MTTFLRHGYSIALEGTVGSTVTLQSLLAQTFGENAQSIPYVWIAYYGTAAMQAWDFSYIDPANPAITSWRVNGTALAPSTPQTYNQQFIDAGQFGSVDLQLGNMFCPQAYLLVRIDRNAASPVYINYALTTVTLGLSNPDPIGRAPKASDIVAAARALVAEHPGIPNANDCGWISMVIGAAAGATLTDASQSLVPTENLEGGYWRIAHRGSAATPANWLSLTKPGDIVRFDWADPSQPQHTTLVTGALRSDGGVTVVDNSGTIREHVAYYDTQSIASTVTIYRIAADGLYLIETTDVAENVFGTSFSDLLRAGGGDDDVRGGLGNDVLVGGTGANVLNGGGGWDRASYSITYAAASLVRTGSGKWTITGAGFVDTLADVEIAEFADRSVALRERAGSDANGEGTSDLMLQSGGTVVQWLMQNGTYQSGSVITTGATGFNVVGKGDFDADGDADVLLQSGGVVVDWIMQNGTYNKGNVITSGAGGFAVVGTGDLDTDGDADVILQSGGTVVSWLMQDGLYQSGSVITTGAAGFNVVGTGDFDGDGDADVVLQSGGTVVTWRMEDGVYQSGSVITTGAVGFKVVGTGDLDGDGDSDIVLQAGGTVVDWIMQNGAYQKGNVVTSGAGAFQVVDVGDYNKDGVADIVLQSNGTIVNWIMQNGVFQSGNTITAGAHGFLVV